MTQNETKIWQNSEPFVEINLRKDDPNHSRTTLFVQVCAMKKIIHTCLKKIIFWHRGHILSLRCCHPIGYKSVMLEMQYLFFKVFNFPLMCVIEFLGSFVHLKGKLLTCEVVMSPFFSFTEKQLRVTPIFYGCTSVVQVYKKLHDTWTYSEN